MTDTPAAPLDLADVLGNAEDQNRGRWFDLLDPVTGLPTGIKLKVAGPDSDIQRRAQINLADRLADLADERGRVSAEDRAKARNEALVACLIDWQVTEGGQSVPLSMRNGVRLLNAASWIREQADRMAGDRAAFWGHR